jgi:hypothetical protein
MTDKSPTPLSKQWQVLHNNYESYEQYALIIKLITVSLTALSMILALNVIFTFFIIAILWLQEAIWKTYQSRLSDVIIKLENDSKDAYPLYSQWQENRPNTAKLVNSYISNALKPTVAFPYAPLMVIVLVFHSWY